MAIKAAALPDRIASRTPSVAADTPRAQEVVPGRLEISWTQIEIWPLLAAALPERRRRPAFGRRPEFLEGDDLSIDLVCSGGLDVQAAVPGRFGTANPYWLAMAG